jgi:hypothetical protein
MKMERRRVLYMLKRESKIKRMGLRKEYTSLSLYSGKTSSPEGILLISSANR